MLLGGEKGILRSTNGSVIALTSNNTKGYPGPTLRIPKD